MSHPSTAPLWFAGYAALFRIPDAARDIIRPGAFARTLREHKHKIPLFWQHNPEQVIGEVETIAEDERGLRVIARIDNADGRAAHMLKRGDISGISFGYRARAYHREEASRVLEDIELFEISLVKQPLQHGARVHLIA